MEPVDGARAWCRAEGGGEKMQTIGAGVSWPPLGTINLSLLLARSQTLDPNVAFPHLHVLLTPMALVPIVGLHSLDRYCLPL